METLPVMFRVQKSGPFKGTVNAVFPTIPADYAGKEMQVFTLEEGHAGGHVAWVYERTRPANEAEAAPVLAELRRIYTELPAERPEIYGEAFTLQPVKRRTAAHRAEFERERRRSIEAVRRNPAGAPWTPEARAACGL